MGKKCFVSAAPLLAIVAFALMPAAAQAANPPHWFVGLGGTFQTPPSASRVAEKNPCSSCFLALL
jgi:hypothetical protein